MKLIDAYTTIDPSSESQFLRRELGITWNKVSQTALLQIVDENLKSGRGTLVIINAEQFWPELISMFPPNSLTVLQLSDETLAEWLLELPKIPSVKSVYRNYSVKPVGLAIFALSFLTNYTHALLFGIKSNEILTAYKQGFRMRQRAIRLHSLRGKAPTEFPLGYTNKFAAAFTQAFGMMNPDVSLFCAPTGIKGRASKRAFVTFSGGEGGFHRSYVLRSIKNMRHVSISLSPSPWNGTEAIGLEANSYIDSLVGNRFALCPPGTVSNESFRFFEALICGSYPLVAPFSITQGTVTNHFGLRNKLLFNPTWIRFVPAIFRNQNRINQEINRAIDQVQRQITQIRSNLLRDTEAASKHQW